MREIGFRLYVISNRRACAPRLLPLVLKQAAQIGVKAVQLREKDLSPDELYRLALDVQESVSAYGARLLINDRADVAAAVGAAGVHLTERSMPAAAARRILGDAALIGVSAHRAEGAAMAEDGGADFVILGPVFQSPSHPETSPIGLHVLEEVASRLRIPVFAVGGITAANAAACLGAGAHGVASVTAVVGAKSVRSAVRSFKRVLGEL
jgi:thiamine-phosphate pyrophosphorylase